MISRFDYMIMRRLLATTECSLNDRLPTQRNCRSQNKLKQNTYEERIAFRGNIDRYSSNKPNHGDHLSVWYAQESELPLGRAVLSVLSPLVDD